MREWFKIPPTNGWLSTKEWPVSCTSFTVPYSWIARSPPMSYIIFNPQVFMAGAYSLRKKNALLRVIPSLTHYSGIVSDVSSGSIYGINTYCLYNYIYTQLYSDTLLAFTLTFYLTFYQTFYLTFYLASIQAVILAFYLALASAILTFYLAFYLASILTFFLAYVLTLSWPRWAECWG